MLRKIPKFHLISWCGNFVESTVIRSKLCGNCAFPWNFHTKKLGQIRVFCAVIIIVSLLFTWNTYDTLIYFYGKLWEGANLLAELAFRSNFLPKTHICTSLVYENMHALYRGELVFFPQRYNHLLKLVSKKVLW